MWFFRFLFDLIFCKLLYKVKYINHNLEKNIDKCVICANHNSYLDAILIFVKSKKVATMGKAELFENKLIAKFFTFLGGFPIKRGEKDAKSIIHAVNTLKKDGFKRLVIFPEGTRVKDENDSDAKIGAVYISMKASVPILPVRIIDENKNKKFFKNITVIYGNPIYYDNTKIKDKEYLKESSDNLMEYIYNIED